MIRRLPVLAERATASIKAQQIQLGQQVADSIKGNTTVTCKKGCANCCSHPIYISIAEGILLYRLLYANRQWSKIKSRIESTRDLTMGLSSEIWLMSNIPCPLLNENKECGAYAARPLRCRTTFSSGDPKLCHPHALGAATPLIDNFSAILQFNQFSKDKLKASGADSFLMPLAEAVLMGELVDSGKMPIEGVRAQYLKDLYGT